MINFATIGNVTLHYADEGQTDRLALVFANSLGTDLRIWDKVIPHFTEKFRVVRYDKRGHGLSDCPPAPYTIHDHSHDLIGLLEHLSISEAILVGISVGGMIVMNTAIHQPERVKAMVLCDTAAKIGNDEMWNERINSLRAKGMAYLGDAILARWFVPSFQVDNPSAYSGYRNLLTRMPVEGYTGTCEALRDADLREQTAMLTMKTLALCGEQDASTPPDLVRGLADALPSARFEVIPDAGHLPCIEQADLMAKLMMEFFKENAYV